MRTNRFLARTRLAVRAVARAVSRRRWTRCGRLEVQREPRLGRDAEVLIRGDARHIPLRDGCVQCCVTSPPYWGLRDYGNPNQIGLEPTPNAYVANIVAVFSEVRRVLKDDGTLWLNIGDTFNNFRVSMNGQTVHNGEQRHKPEGRRKVDALLKEKDLVGIPWRVAFALQADGWYLRSDIIWSKPNPMPESVTDRPTKAHEYLFLLAKSERYYYDADAIREPFNCGEPRPMGNRVASAHGVTKLTGNMDPVRKLSSMNAAGRNRRSVWSVTTMPYAGAHFATMPEKLVEPCILAGCPIGSVVIDPFIGSGTVGAVAERLGRRWVGIDLSYQDLAKKRTAQRGLLMEASA